MPISSSGHLFLLPELLHWRDPGAGFTAVIQLGTILAVLLYFRDDLLDVSTAWARSLFKPSAARTDSARIGWAILVGTVPISVAGLLLESKIDRDFRSAYVVASTLIFFAVFLAIAERVATQRRSFTDATWKDGLVVGLWQTLALVPGSSRSGCTITGGLFSGFDRAAAARFSFLLSVPAIVLSGLYKLYKERDVLLASGMAPTIVATVVAFVSGYAAIVFLMKFLQTRTTMVFVWYRIALGLVIFALASGGVIATHPQAETGEVLQQTH
ncbi:MAG: undecaprenyl-diphosphatase UppP [Fimbriimonadaceae bacterium]|nr:undecaprenyl-diphosphatase UppP [Fimbriimonadaceae bacterium]QYK56960.1 MAG: undecaprenyl-diphosphatase UppP [Fimbriimonadaceae bacterium]